MRITEISEAVETTLDQHVWALSEWLNGDAMSLVNDEGERFSPAPYYATMVALAKVVPPVKRNNLSGMLYRGVGFENEQDFTSGRVKTAVKRYQSWSGDRGVAVGFAKNYGGRYGVVFSADVASNRGAIVLSMADVLAWLRTNPEGIDPRAMADHIYQFERYAEQDEVIVKGSMVHVTDVKVVKKPRAKVTEGWDDDRPAHERYMFGQCMVMAATLARRYGWQLVGIFEDGEQRVPRHVGVQRPDGRYADARGVRQSEEEFLLVRGQIHHRGQEIRPMSLDQFKDIWGRRIKDWDVPAHDMKELGLPTWGPIPTLQEQFQPAPEKLPATPENISAAKTFLMKKWVERHRERNGYTAEPPLDLSSSCKFTSLFARAIFGGKLAGNWNHQYVILPSGEILDLNVDAADVKAMGNAAYQHDSKWWNNRDHRASLASCRARVEQWVEEFRAGLPQQEPETELKDSPDTDRLG